MQKEMLMVVKVARTSLFIRSFKSLKTTSEIEVTKSEILKNWNSVLQEKNVKFALSVLTRTASKKLANTIFYPKLMTRHLLSVFHVKIL